MPVFGAVFGLNRGQAMTLTHITIPTAILRLKDLNIRQKLLLALIVSFNKKGFRMLNPAISEILNIRSDTISKLLADLEHKKYIKITNARSRYRTIYFGEKSKLHFGEIPKVDNSTLEKNAAYFGENSKHNIKNLKKSAHRARKPLCDDGAFDRFWDAYPKKQKRLDAQRAWKKLNPDTELTERIIKDVQIRSQRFDWQKENGKYVPMPTTYLNGQRWTDELPEPKRGDPDWLPDEQEAEAIMKDAGL
jgi:DNA-binding MarR family transcriptional regulator